MKPLKIFFVSVFLLAGSVLYSQQDATYNFLKLEVDARSAALAGTFTTITNDVNAIFYNPASISTIEKKQASVGFFKYLLDINSGNAAYTQKIKDYGYFGAGLRFINYGEFEKYDENFNNLGTTSATDIALNLTYSNIYESSIHYGASLKFIYSSIDEFKSTGVALDLGILYNLPSDKFSVGASLLNLGTQLSTYNGTRENLPIEFKIGVSKELEHLPLLFNVGFSNLALETDNFFDRFKTFTLGGEFTLNEYVDLRIGYNNMQRQDFKTGNTAGLGGFSAGIGFNYEEKYLLDYSFNSMGKIGATHRINLRFILE